MKLGGNLPLGHDALLFKWHGRRRQITRSFSTLAPSPGESVDNGGEFPQTKPNLFLFYLQAFANMTLATRRALCAVMVFAVVEKAGTVVMNDGEELDSWSVILNGHVEIERPDATIEHLHMGDRCVPGTPSGTCRKTQIGFIYILQSTETPNCST